MASSSFPVSGASSTFGVRRVLALVLAAVLATAGMVALGPATHASAAPTPISNAKVSAESGTQTTQATQVANPCGNSINNPNACGTNVTMTYGKGSRYKLDSFTAAGLDFNVLPTDPSSAYTRVTRVDNSSASGQRQNVFMSNPDGTTAGSGARFSVTSEQNDNLTMEDVLGSPYITEGTDNTFANTGGVTVNNVERISILRKKAVSTSDPSHIGVTVLERGGNDAYKIAAVTAVDGNGNPTAWGPVVSAGGGSSAWGPIRSVSSTVMQKKPSDSMYRPLDWTAAQQISGQFVSLQDLGVSAGQQIYGVSLVGNDETSMNPGSWKTNTNSDTNGGLDMVGAVFVSAIKPTAKDVSSTGTQGATQNIPLDYAAGDSLTPIDTSQTRLIAPDGGTVNSDGTKVTVPGEGTYTLNRSSGSVSFAPVPSFSGTAKAPSYEVTDAAGSTVSAKIRPTVTGVAKPDTTTGPQATPQTASVLDNDKADGVSLDASTLKLVDGSGNAVDSLTVSGEGTYAVKDGKIVFTPVTSFVGTAKPVTYQVKDSRGNAMTSTYTPTVTIAAPRATPDTETTGRNTPVTLSPAANDKPGVDGGSALVKSSVRLLDGSTPVTSLTTDQGTFTVDTSTGDVTFTPKKGFVGTATAPYQIKDGNGQVGKSTITITVDDAFPSAKDDSDTTKQGAAKTVDILGNDTPGNESTPIDRSSVVLTTEGQKSDAVVSDGGKKLTVPGEGVYTVASDGKVTFTPEASFTGTATGVTYQVSDQDERQVSAVLTMTVTGVPPRAAADTTTTERNTAVEIDPSKNDKPGVDDGTPVDPKSVRLLNSSGDPVEKLTTSQGTFAVDTSTGKVTFTPAQGFTGTATAPYQVADTNKLTAKSTITVTVTDAAPTAKDDADETDQGSPVTVPVLANDTAGNAATPLDPTTVQLTTSGIDGAQLSDDGKKLTVPGEGVYTVDDSGQIRFAPEATFVGKASAVTYTVKDKDARSVQAELTITVNPVAPRAQDDSATTQRNTPVKLSPADNDQPGVDGGTPVDPKTVRLLDGSDPVEELTTDEGTFAVDSETGEVTFTPKKGFTGTATAKYRIQDGNGESATATLTVTVEDADPTASDDTGETDQGSPVTVEVAGNDSPANENSPLDPSSVVLTDKGVEGAEVSEDGKKLTVDGEGVYTVESDGRITFTPEPKFVGEASPVTYEISDEDGRTATATLTITVAPVAPRAKPDTETTGQNTPVKISPADNDEPGVDGGTPLDPTSVRLRNADGEAVEELETDEGTFTVDPDSGEVTFSPKQGFTGEATADYEITDENGKTSVSTITVTVTAATPSADDDTASTDQGSPVDVDVLGNDEAGNAKTPLDPSTVVLTDSGIDGAEVSDDGKKLTVPDEGTYTVAEDGTVTFTPVPAFVGTATPVTYQVADVDGATATAKLTVTVDPVAPRAQPDADTTQRNTAVTVDPAANDQPGVDGGTAVDPKSVRLLDGDTAVEELETDEGTFAVDTATGRVTFTPKKGFTGTATAPYRVSDGNDQTADSTITITVTDVTPRATDDAGSTKQGSAVDIDVLANDTAGNEKTPLVPGSVVLTDSGIDGAEVSEDGKKLTVPGEGTYTVADDGTITFTPVARFVGDTTPITYGVSDSDDRQVTAKVSVNVDPVAPRPAPDNATTERNTPVEIDPSANDATGVDGGTPVVPDSVRLRDEDGNAVSELTTDEGTFVVDTETGKVTFTPKKGFTGTSKVTYEVTDEKGKTSTSTITVEVEDVAVTANDDTASTDQGSPVEVSVLGNDTAGNEKTPLVPGSVVLTDSGIDGAEVSEDGKKLTVPGEGVYSVSEDGKVTFAPEAKFVGTAKPVTYKVSDSDDREASAELTVTVAAVPPRTSADEASTERNTPVEIDPSANDRPGVDGGTAIDPSSVRLRDEDGNAVSELTTDEGTFVVDTETGKVTFTPKKGFTGTSKVTYEVTDENGKTSTSTITVEVQDVTATAADDTASTDQGSDVTVDVLANDEAGNEKTPLDPSTVVLTDSGIDGAEVSEDGKKLTVPGEGVYTVAEDGKITFAPEPTFRGTAKPVTYKVSDSDDRTVDAKLTVSVDAVAPRTQPDSESTGRNTPVTFNPADNDRPGVDDGTAVDPKTVRLLDEDGHPVVTLETDEGTFTVDQETGDVTFTPKKGFTGTATAKYVVTDVDGATSEPTPITVAVDASLGSATDDAATTDQGSPVDLAVADNDRAGNENSPLVPGSVVLTDSGITGAEVSEDGKKLTVPGEGVYTVDGKGVVTFTPEPRFVGKTTPVTYRISDDDGNDYTAKITVAVDAVGPRTAADSTTTERNTPVEIDPLANDTPGVEGGTPLDPSSLRLLDEDGKPVTELTTDTGTFRVDPKTGKVTFTPKKGATGTSTVTYRVADENGETSESTITVTVQDVEPAAKDDKGTTRQGEKVSVDVLGNDSAGNENSPLDAKSVVLLDPGIKGAKLSEDGKKLTVPGEGVYTVGKDGKITFTPERAFAGKASPVLYQVADSDGATTSATLRITVTAVPPAVKPDKGTTTPGESVTVDPTANDGPGIDGGSPIDRSSVRLVDGNGHLVTEMTTSQGHFVVDTKTGKITFTPAKGFTGKATVTYQVSDENGATSRSTVTFVVEADDEPAPPSDSPTPGDPSPSAPAPSDPGPSESPAPSSPGDPLVPTGEPEGRGPDLWLAGAGALLLIGAVGLGIAAIRRRREH